MLNRLFKIERDYLFSLEDIDNKKDIKKGILVLESEYFEVIKIILEENLSDREREYEIEEQLGNRILNYETDDYVEKEIFIGKKDGIEELVIILIKREKIYEIIDKIREKKIEIDGIIPILLLNYLSNTEKRNEIFLDIGIVRTSVVVFKEGRLKDVITIDTERTEIFYSQQEFNELLDRIMFSIEEESFDTIDKIIIYEKDKELRDFIEKSELSRKELIIEDWKEWKILFDKSFDFLPLEYRKRIEQKKYIKYGIYLFLGILVVEFFSFFFFLNAIKNEKKSIENKEIALGEIKEKIERRREEIKEIENFKEKKDKLMEKINFGKFKLSEVLEELKKCKMPGMNFIEIEYNGKDMLKIVGKAQKEKEIYEFEKNILRNEIFFHLNHDYIKKQDEEYEFQIDIGVKNENNK